MKDHLYFFESNCYAYTSKRASFPPTSRPHAVLLFSADGTPFRLETRQRVFIGSAMAVAPQTARTLRLSGAGLLSINLPPSSPLFPAFRGIGAGGAHVLERAVFDRFDDFIVGAYQGAGKQLLTEQSFQQLLALAIDQLPRTQPLDERVPPMLRFLDANPNTSLVDLAQRFALSHHRISHLISSSVGLSFKAYQSWQKQVRVCKLLYSNQSLTTIAHEAGLTDSAHLSRFYQHWYGQSPSYSRDFNSVQFFSR